MKLFVVGINHRTADVQLREKLAYPENMLRDSLKELCSVQGIHGAVILSTCNRTEVYVHALDATTAHNGVCDFLAQRAGVDRPALEKHLFVHDGFEAARHLFTVVSSLDSMVLGEAQIAGQVRTAFKAAHGAGSATALISRVFRQALEVGKRVRTQTGIGDAHVSLSTVAVDVALDTFGQLQDCTVLIVGSGKMSELAARYLQEQGATSLLVASRTHAHACSVAQEVGGSAHYFEELVDLIQQADIVISSTAAPHYVIVPEVLRDVSGPLLILDLALPRDVDPACAEIEGVKLCDLDDLGTIAAFNQRSRENCSEAVAAIVDEEVGMLQEWVAQHAVTPTIKQMRASAEEVRTHEVEHLLKVLHTDLCDEDVKAIEAATSAIVNKMLHAPTVALKSSVASQTDFECVEAARTLFALSAAAADAGQE